MKSGYSGLDEARDCCAYDPHRALRLESQYIVDNPDDARGYFSRHLTWMKLGNYTNALEDCCRAIGIAPQLNRYMARAEIYRALGDHAKAVADLNHVCNSDYERWLNSFGPHLRADALARLGRLDEALRDAALIREDHWMPEHDGLPGGTKEDFINEIKLRAATANPDRR